MWICKCCSCSSSSCGGGRRSYEKVRGQEGRNLGLARAALAGSCMSQPRHCQTRNYLIGHHDACCKHPHSVVDLGRQVYHNVLSPRSPDLSDKSPLLQSKVDVAREMTFLNGFLFHAYLKNSRLSPCSYAHDVCALALLHLKNTLLP